MASVDELSLAESQIRSLLVRERYYRDTCQWEKMRDAYHPDASKTRVHIQWYDGDIDGFVAASSKVVSHRINTVHSINPTEIDIRGIKALSVSFCTMTSRFERQGFEYDKISTVRLLSRLERLHPSASQTSTSAPQPSTPPWKLLTLECIYIRDSVVPAAPHPSDAVVPCFAAANKFPRAYRYSAWLLSTIGIESRDDSLREDDPDGVARVFAESWRWIDAS